MLDVEPMKARPSARISLPENDDNQRKKRWSPMPKPVSESENPCETKKLQLKISSSLKESVYVVTIVHMLNHRKALLSIFAAMDMNTSAFRWRVFVRSLIKGGAFCTFFSKCYPFHSFEC